MVYASTTRPVYEDEALITYLDLHLSFLRLVSQQQPTSTEYRQVYRQAIMLALEHNTRFWLTDSRQVLYLHQVDQHWMYAKMRPLLKGGKLQQMAIVLQPETLIMTDQQPLREKGGSSFQEKRLFSPGVLFGFGFGFRLAPRGKIRAGSLSCSKCITAYNFY